MDVDRNSIGNQSNRLLRTCDRIHSMSAAAAAAAAAMKEEEEEVAVVPLSGYRFLPTDLELVRDYLRKKITNKKLPSDVPVVEYDIYSTEPWNLPVNNIIDTINTNRSYYFVKLLDGIHRRRQRIVPNHSNSHDGGGGGGGYWKKNIAGGCSYTRYIRDETYRSIGVKKSFVFHAYLSSPAPGIHTNNNNNNINSSIFADDEEEEDEGTTTTTSTAMTTWKTNLIMDEYSLKTQRTQPWVLCVLSKKGGGEEGDEMELLSKLKQVQQQQEKLQERNHACPEFELQLLEMIKTTQERIKTNQKQIWQDQCNLGMYTKLRVTSRYLKKKQILAACNERLKQIKGEFSQDKITIEESQELEKQLWEEYERRKAAIEAEMDVIWGGSSYVEQLPSNFRRVRRGNRNFNTPSIPF